jgi:hypothetical protein
MADLVRIAPLDISATGDDVEQGFKNDDADIKNLYSLMNKVRGMYYGATAPQNPNLGDKWHKSTDDKIYRWDGDSWEPLTFEADGGHADTADTATNATDHINDATGAHNASAIANTPDGNIVSTTVQGAINELDTGKAKLAGDASQVFSVANATTVAHALALGQLTGTLASSGHVKIPIMDGATLKHFVIQWGNATSSVDVSFPIAFTACYGAFAISGNGYSQNATNVTATGFTIGHYNGTGLPAYWFAYGYKEVV